MAQLTLKDVAEGAGVRVKTLSDWRRKGLPVREEGRACLVEPLEAVAWLEGRAWHVDSVARGKVIAYLRAVAGAAAPSTHTPAPEHASFAAGIGAAVAVPDLAPRRVDPTKPDQVRDVVADMLDQLQAELRGPIPANRRAALTGAVVKLLSHGEELRLNTLETAIRMRKLIRAAEAVAFARELALAAAQAFDRVPPQSAELVLAGLDPEEAAFRACGEAREALARAIEDATARMEGGDADTPTAA